MTFKAITFDADQTLWDFADVYRQALDASISEIVSRGYAAADQATPEVLRSIRDEVVMECRGRPHSLEAVRRRSFEVFLERVGHETPAESAASLTHRYLQVRFNAITLYPEVEAVLDRLGERYPLGLVSNGNTYPDRCGLPKTFTATVMGPDHGIEKPDPRAFELAASGLGVGPRELLHVGDDWDDVEGANAVGAISVLINRSGGKASFAAEADHEVSNLLELEALIEVLG